jgi:nucleotide-binding universal stress UspA family protein
MFKKILVCLDGSTLAEEILPIATEQALRFNSKVVLLQVVNSPASIMPATAMEAGMLVPPTESEIDLNLRQARETQKEVLGYLENKARLFSKKGVEVEFAVIEGRPGQVILEYASRNCIELIALVTHGRGGLGRAIYGSVADYVLKNSGLPMLLIRPKT